MTPDTSSEMTRVTLRATVINVWTRCICLAYLFVRHAMSPSLFSVPLKYFLSTFLFLMVTRKLTHIQYYHCIS